jgi:hypothetical protein
VLYPEMIELLRRWKRDNQNNESVSSGVSSLEYGD